MEMSRATPDFDGSDLEDHCRASDLLDDAHVVVRRQGDATFQGLIHDCIDVGFQENSCAILKP